MKLSIVIFILLSFFSQQNFAYDEVWSNLSEGKFYTYNTPPLISYEDKYPVEFTDGTKFSDGVYLTDGDAGNSWPINQNWVAWKDKQVSIVVDLGRDHYLSHIQIRAMSRDAWTIRYPEWVNIFTSLDGTTWSYHGTINFPSGPANGSYQTHIASQAVNWPLARYVQYQFPYHEDHLFLDELFIYGATRNNYPKLEPTSGTNYGAYPVDITENLTISSFENTTNSNLDTILWYRTLTQTNGNLYNDFYNHLTNTLLPAITGKQLQLAFLPNDVTTEDLANGSQDENIRSFFQAIKDVDYPMWIRMMPEMNGCWTNPVELDPCGAINDSLSYGGNPDSFIRAWQRIFNIAQKLGVDGSNYAFIWAPDTGFNSDLYYPGDNYVDWVGMSVYINDCIELSCESDFENKIMPYEIKYGSRKPLMIAEGGCRHTLVSYERVLKITEGCINSWLSAVTDFDLEAIVYFNQFNSRLENPNHPAIKLNTYKSFFFNGGFNQ